MKMKIAIIALAALSFASCNKNDEFKENSNFPTDGVIRVATSVDGHKTRAGMTTENIVQFNIHITNAANSAYSYYGYYLKPGDVWNCYTDGTISTPLTMLWQNSTQVVTVSALSQYGSSYIKDLYEANTSYFISTNQSDEHFLEASDILYMAPTVINPATDLVNGKLPITFKHIMSKVNLTITLGTELNITPGTATNPITDLTISGTKPRFRWNASTNSAFDVSGQAVASITPWDNAAAYTAGNGTTTKAVAKYEVILVPQTVAANGFTVNFKINGKPYEWTSPTAITLEKGTLYELNLTAGKDIVNLGGLTASEWGAGTGGNIETE